MAYILHLQARKEGFLEEMHHSEQRDVTTQFVQKSGTCLIFFTYHLDCHSFITHLKIIIYTDQLLSLLISTAYAKP